MVLRGWIPEGGKPPRPSDGTLKGTLRYPHKLSAFTPENTEDAWYTLNLGDMEQALHQKVEPYYVVMGDPSGYEGVVDPAIKSRDDDGIYGTSIATTVHSIGGEMKSHEYQITPGNLVAPQPMLRPSGGEAVNVDKFSRPRGDEAVSDNKFNRTELSEGGTATTVAAGLVSRPRGDEVVSDNKLKTLPQVPEIPNNHLQYIITWYSLAVAVAFAALVKFRSLKKDASPL